jgi:hypothetical protein
MPDERRDSFIIFADRTPAKPLGRRSAASISGWGVLAVVAIGALLAIDGVLGLTVGDRLDSYGSVGGGALDGVYLARVALGVGLLMRKELARRVSLVFAIIGLVATVTSPASYSASFASYALGISLDVGTLALLLHPRVKRAFD